MNKITIIGTGSVGSTIAYTLTVMGVASEIVMIDINKEKAMGEALDIRQGIPFCNPSRVYAGSYSDASNSDIIVITSGVARKPGQSRLDLAQTNVNILKSIIPDIVRHAPNAVYLVVSNPVDVLTYTFCKLSGLPERQVIGSGTILDTSRLRARLSEYYSINQQNVHAYVLGEHGDSSFVPWSVANISNIPLEEGNNSLIDVTTATTQFNCPKLDFEEVENYVRKSGGQVIERKGATYYAVSASVCHVCKSILNGIDTTMTVSTMLHGEYGIDDVCLSLLTLVGKHGAVNKMLLPLTDAEQQKLIYSAECLKNVLRQIEI